MPGASVQGQKQSVPENCLIRLSCWFQLQEACPPADLALLLVVCDPCQGWM